MDRASPLALFPGTATLQLTPHLILFQNRVGQRTLRAHRVGQRPLRDFLIDSLSRPEARLSSIPPWDRVSPDALLLSPSSQSRGAPHFTRIFVTLHATKALDLILNSHYIETRWQQKPRITAKWRRQCVPRGNRHPTR
jgi:hypothetical protein